MKGKIEKYKDSLYSGKITYRIEYQKGDLHMPHWLDIYEEDMEEFMENIHEDWNEILTDKLNKLCKSVMREEIKKGKQDK